MSVEVGFPYQTVYDIVDITQACPCVVTLSETSRQYALSLANAQSVTISRPGGMIQISGLRFIVMNLDTGAMTLELYDLFGDPFDSRSFNAYTSGGQLNIISYPGTPPGLIYNNQ